MDDPGELNSEGYQLYLQDKYEKAVRKYDSALKLKEDFPEALYNRGLAYQQLRNHDKAIEDFSRAIEIFRSLVKRGVLDLDPESACYLKWIGNCYYSLGNYGKALKYYEEALKYSEEGLRIKPEYAAIHYNKGVVFAAQGEYKKSLKCYETALRHNPNCHLAHSSKSYMLYILERYQDALEACNQCLKICSNYKYALSNKGIILLRLGYYKEALEVLEKAVKLYPTFDEAWYQKGSVHFFLEQFNKALDAFDKVIELNKGFVVESWGYKGVIFAKLDNDKKAEEAFSNGEQAVDEYIKGIKRIKGTNNEYYVITKKEYEKIKEEKYEKYRIRLLIRRCFASYLFGEYKEALDLLKSINKTSTTDRTCITLLNLKKTAFERLVEHNEIEKNLKEALSLLKRAKGDKSKIYHEKGLIRGRQGYYRDSVECFRRALEENPAHFKSMNELGITFLKCGKPYEALEAFENAIRSNPNCYEAWINKALVLRGLLEHKESEYCFNKAKEILKAALDLNENYSVANYNIGLIHYEHQEYKEAIESFEKASRSKDYYEDAEINKGLSLFSLKKYDEAIYVFDQIIHTRKNNKEVKVNSLNNKGIVLLCQGKDKVAYGLFKKAAEIDKFNADSINNMGLTECYQRRYGDSSANFDISIRIGNRYGQLLGDPWYNKGLLLFRMGEYEKSVEAFDKSIHINPDCSSARKNKGIILCVLGRYEEALQMFKEASLIRPNEGEIHILRAGTLLKLDDIQKADQEINKVFKNPNSLLKPGNIQEYDGGRENVFKDPVMSSHEKSKAYTIKGQIEVDKLNYDNAITCFEKAIYYNPSDLSLSVWNAYARYLKAEFLTSKKKDKSQMQNSEKIDPINEKYREGIISIIRDLEKISVEFDKRKKNIKLPGTEYEREKIDKEKLSEEYVYYLTGYLYYKINDFYSALDKLQKCISLKPRKNGNQTIGSVDEQKSVKEPAKILINNIWEYQINPPFWRWWLESPINKETKREFFGATSLLVFIALFPEFTRDLVLALIDFLASFPSVSSLISSLPAPLKGLIQDVNALIPEFFNSINETTQYIILAILFFILLFPSIEHIKGKDLEIKLKNSPAPFNNFYPLTPDLTPEKSTALRLTNLGQIKKRPKPLEIHEIRDQTSLDVK
ncbi:MAG: tetratricopeptide repeat protein [Methanosarcina sp.]